MTKRLYYESNALNTSAIVKSVGHDDSGHWVVLDQTVAHVKGGGAKADRGTIGGFPFHDVIAPDGRHGDVYHLLETAPHFAVGYTVHMVINADFRREQSAYHNAGHLIAAIIEARYPALKAVSGHHYPGEARVEFVCKILPDVEEIPVLLNSALVDDILYDLPVLVLGETYQDRKIQIGTYPAVPCGGVHPVSTACLGLVEVKGVKVKGDTLRISYHVKTP